jgi:hemin uptake protein HemP
MAEQKHKLTQELKSESESESESELIQEPIVMEAKNNLETTTQQKTIHSHDLLQHGKEIFILHRGDQYRLRCTRNDKLILTK